MSKKNTPAKRSARQARDQKARQRAERRRDTQPAEALGKLARLLALGGALAEQARARGPELLGLKGAEASDLFLAVDPSMREQVIAQAREQSKTMGQVADGVAAEIRRAIAEGRQDAARELVQSPELRDAWIEAADRALTWVQEPGSPGIRVGTAVLRSRALSEAAPQKGAWAPEGFGQLRAALANVLEISVEDVFVGEHPIDLLWAEPTLGHFEAISGGARGVGAGLAGDGEEPRQGWLGFVVSARCEAGKLAAAERIMADLTLGELAGGRLDFFSTLLAERLANAAGGSGSPMTFAASQMVDGEPREVEFCLEGIDDPMSAALAAEREAVERAMESISAAASIAVAQGADKEKMDIVLDLGMLYADDAQARGAARAAMVSFCAKSPERSFGLTFGVSDTEHPMAFAQALMTVFSQRFDLSTESHKGLATIMFCEPREGSYVDAEGRLLFWTPDGMTALRSPSAPAAA